MKRRQRPANQPEQCLYRFNQTPPDAAMCLEAVYVAFSHYRPVWNWCRQCFTSENEERTRAAGPLHRAKLEDFDQIYYEHPNCSGGRDTFLHFLPRALELAFLKSETDYFLIHYTLRVGLWRFDKTEQDALRTLFCRVAINWFIYNDTAPLLLPLAMKENRLEDYVSDCIIQALLTLRVDPFDLVCWLARLKNSKACIALLDLSITAYPIENPSYYVLDDKADEVVQRRAVDALIPLTRDASGRMASDKRLLRLWLWAESANPPLAREIEEVQSSLSDQRQRLTRSERIQARIELCAAVRKPEEMHKNAINRIKIKDR
ncbi:hypothetical protein [Rhizobium skierniewicense]|uniref:hypothetical protein n=1 Tax=Rhizobium skierniewicense TaxID=984260 RepID=UPI00157213E2|nr:hypothetical protein [Rhizobium skierniewicense]NTF32748.1 hypothetical protein [Rhizobium skierniewicense]